ncbi:MAG: ribonuclease J [Candidatus Kaiserbacteria bacterium]|nr:ribonuclease J [Candidatus Kaiserbacteria bacterium]
MAIPKRNYRQSRPSHIKSKTVDTKKPKKVFIPKPNKGEIRTLVFGGISEIGKNMYGIEYNNTIVLLECGTMFGESSTPGVNAVMPNIQYLKDRKQDVKALIVTDASMKHIGAIPYVTRALGDPVLYTRKLTKAIIENHQNTLRGTLHVSFHEVEKAESVVVNDDVTLHFFGIADNAPSTLGVLIETPSGCIAYTGNLKVSHNKEIIRAEEEEAFKAAKEKDVILSLADSVGSERPGFAITDHEIVEEVDQMMQEAPHRVLIPLFPSQIKRNAMLLEKAFRAGKKTYVEGALLLENLQTASELGIMQMPKESLIPIQEMKKDDDSEEVFIAFTAEENEICEALESISRESYRHTSVITKDTIIFPSPMISANAQATQNLKDRLSRLGAITRSYNTSDVKGSGHANKSELRWMHQLLNAKFFIPVQGYHYMLNAHTHILRELGMSQDSFAVPENGSIIDVSPDGKVIKKQKQRMETTAVSVDGHTLSPVQDVVVQDRNTLSQEGIFIIIVFIDRKTLEVKKSPDIISRGFIYLRESQDLIARVRIVIKKAAEKEAKETGRVEIDKMKKAIQKEVQTFLVNETNKRPIVVPVIFTQ